MCLIKLSFFFFILFDLVKAIRHVLVIVCDGENLGSN